MADGEIIIKKIIKGGGGGHHGGAWKVAYADFVTAMMAFFLLMWLINVTTPAQKMGLAEYFTPTIGIKGNMGIGFKGGKKPTPDVGRANTDLNAVGLVEGQIHQGPMPQAPEPTPPAKADEDAESSSAGKSARGQGPAPKPSKVDPNNPTAADGAADNKLDKNSKSGNSSKESDDTDSQDSTDNEQFKMTSEDIKQALEKDPNLKDFKNDVVVQDTPEGLKIDMIDDPRQSMFIPGGAVISDAGKKILDSMANIVSKTPNHIAITGHTDSGGAISNPNYTNWELSADRANAARRALVTTQVESDRVQKVIGLADRDPLSPQEPASPRNRRITIVLVRGSYYRDPKAVATTRGLLSVQDTTIKKEEVKKDDNTSTAIQKPVGPSIFDPVQPNQAPAAAGGK